VTLSAISFTSPNLNREIEHKENKSSSLGIARGEDNREEEGGEEGGRDELKEEEKEEDGPEMG